jgi:hypothetical protein
VKNDCIARHKWQSTFVAQSHNNKWLLPINLLTNAQAA